MSAQPTFPWQIYPPDFVESLKVIAHHNNIPLPYLGAQGLFAIASLAGNMYMGDIGGLTKPIIYLAKIGPSGVGKTPSYHKIIGDIISPLRVQYNDEFTRELVEYKQAVLQAKQAKQECERTAPIKRLRITETATQEAIYKYCETSPAGFGVVYDEGERFFSEINKYSGGGSVLSFWNESFNGRTTAVSRVDSEKERFISSPAVSIDIGLQSARMGNYFTPDAIESGILNRFLMVECDYQPFNEDIDLFSPRISLPDEWRSLIIYLFKKGNEFTQGQAHAVKTHPSARTLINQYAREMIKHSNKLMNNIIDGDASRHVFNYRSKLFTYFQRFCLILAIMRDARSPEITTTEVHGAKDLCTYFEGQAVSIIYRLFNSASSGLTQNEQDLLLQLPDTFNIKHAESVCRDMNLSERFFAMAFQRKFKPKGFILRTMKGMYEKV